MHLILVNTMMNIINNLKSITNYKIYSLIIIYRNFGMERVIKKN